MHANLLWHFLTSLLIFLICGWILTSTVPVTSAEHLQGTPASTNISHDKRKESYLVPIKPLTKEKLEHLLGQRLNGTIEYQFKQFANMFLVSSRLQLDLGIVLMTNSEEIGNRPLRSVFPEFYKPTLRELLDMIALQTSSRWDYNPNKQFLHGSVRDQTPIEEIALFEFTPTERILPYEIKLASGWKSIDKGNWVMYVPPNFPVGVDIYQNGTYSCDDKNKEPALLKELPKKIALDWAKRVKADATEEDLKKGKVGDFDAIAFDAMVPSKAAKIHWRHWVFMDGNQCYFIVSTIVPEYENTLFRDVQAMLKSFCVK